MSILIEKNVLSNRFVNEKFIAVCRFYPETGFRSYSYLRFTFLSFYLNIFITECEKYGSSM